MLMPPSYILNYLINVDAPELRLLKSPRKKTLLKTLSLTALALSGCFAFSSVSAEVSYQQDFEKGGAFEFERYDNGRKGAYFWDTFKNSGNHPTIEQAPQRSGKAGKFYLSKDGTGTTLRNKNWDGDPEKAKCLPKLECTSRTEVTINDKSNGDFELGKEYWIKLDYRYEHWEKEVEADPGRDYMIGPMQVHTRRSKGCNDSFGSATFNAPFLMKAYDNELRFLTRGAKVLWRGNIKLKQWVNIVVHFKLSYSGDGFIEVWQDGSKLGKVTGANYVEFDKCDGRMRSGFFKMGLYNAAWEVPKNPGSFKNVEREIWIDNLEIGTGYPDNVGTPPDNDTTAPSTPTGIKASEITDTSIKLNWNASSDNVGVSAYEVQYNSKVKTVSNTSTTLTGLAANTHYSIKIRAVDAADNYSSYSPVKTVITEPTNTDPTGLIDIDRNAQTKNGARYIEGQGLSLDGVDDYLDLGPLDVSGNAMTISLRFRSDDLANCASHDCRLISKAVGVAEQDHYFMLSTLKTGANTRLRFRLKTNDQTSTMVANEGNIFNNVWTHVAAVYDGQRMQLYKDGVKIGSIPKTGNISTNANVPVWIGANPPDATSRPWKGNIDALRIYQRALSDAEILALFESAGDGDPTDSDSNTASTVSNILLLLE